MRHPPAKSQLNQPRPAQPPSAPSAPSAGALSRLRLNSAPKVKTCSWLGRRTPSKLWLNQVPKTRFSRPSGSSWEAFLNPTPAWVGAGLRCPRKLGESLDPAVFFLECEARYCSKACKYQQYIRFCSVGVASKPHRKSSVSFLIRMRKRTFMGQVHCWRTFDFTKQHKEPKTQKKKSNPPPQKKKKTASRCVSWPREMGSAAPSSADSG